MILGAGLLVLAGLGLFVAALLTGVDALYWACIAACVAAAALLVVARREIAARATPSGSAARGAGGRDDVVDPASQGATVASASAAGARGATNAAAADSRAPEPAHDRAGAVVQDEADPEVEEVEVTDLLLVVDLTDEVLVVDEHPRYHVAGCTWVGRRETIPIPVDEARTDGFTPCAVCRPDRTLADRTRSRR
ncbi:hypothetical protein [Blastococcus saxobsidens]|uniref:Uncharacterized protein n=1 Tax=Blastococcus saxobsidens TaxID=138336 RepID=A0A4Q7Y4N9_9ACTN|nr:hypothetical protein [Blastococcus saxobsidens]RZU31374.1 hypothetical protein BKA19_1033 [Blastococcus saxobsidens]